MADAFYTPHYDVADTWVEPVHLLGTKLDVVPTAVGHPPVIHVHTGNTQFLDTNHNIEITESVGEHQMQGQIEPLGRGWRITGLPVPYDAAVSGPAAGCGVEVADGPDGVREKLVSYMIRVS